MIRKKSLFSGVPRSGKRDPTQDAITENIEVLTGQRGNKLNKALLWRDLVNLDELRRQALVSSIKQGNSNNTGTPVVIGGGVESPHAPVNLQSVGGFTFIALTWDNPTYSGHAYAEIYRGETDSFSNSVRVSTEISNTYSDSVNMGAAYYYWVRFVNVADMVGPIQSANGLYVAAIQSAIAILNELEGMIELTHFGDFLSGEVGKIPDLAFDIDQARLAAEEVLSSNDGLAIDVMNSALANDENWLNVNLSIAALSNTVNQNNASVAFDYYTKVAADAAIAIQNQLLEAKIINPDGDSLGASVQQLSYTVASNYGNFTAMWGVRTDVNEITASFGLLNDGENPIFAIKGSKFAIITSQNPDDITPVFAVVDGKTVIEKALIDEAHIKTLVTDDLFSDRLIVGAELNTPSINYNKNTGNRSQNFSIDPSGNMVAKSAVLESVTIKDSLGNVVMSSTGAIPKNNISGLGSFAGLNKILSTNVTTYIESGAIGTAQIDQAYIAQLFGINATFSGEVFAEKITGDLVDGDTTYVSAASTAIYTSWTTIKSILVQRSDKYAVWLTIEDLHYAFNSVAGFGVIFTQLKYGGSTGKAVSIPQGASTVTVEIQVKKYENANSEVPVEVTVPGQYAALQMFRKGSGFIV